MSDNLAETLAAVVRGEMPPCPFCGMGGVQMKCNGAARWLCGCMVYNDTGVRSLRTVSCCEREIAALHEKNERLRDAVVLAINDVERASYMNGAHANCAPWLWTAVDVLHDVLDGKEDA